MSSKHDRKNLKIFEKIDQKLEMYPTSVFCHKNVANKCFLPKKCDQQVCVKKKIEMCRNLTLENFVQKIRQKRADAFWPKKPNFVHKK